MQTDEQPAARGRPAGKERRGRSRTIGRAARLPLFVASVLCGIAFSVQAQASLPDKKQVSARKLGLDIRVTGSGWGSARREDIEFVLNAVADELLTQLPRNLSAPIVVRHTEGNPVALYQRGPDGEYVVHLHARDQSWPLFAYEFAHELCHILSNYAENLGPGARRHNQWFEEALCETASLYVLRSLATRWEAEPPSPAWAAQAPQLRAFADRLVAEDHRQLPADTGLASWIATHEDRLRRDPYLRDKNEVVANVLLPLFERQPAGWEAIRYLNLSPADGRNRLQDYLRNWYANCPDEHRRFIADVLALVGVPDIMAAGPEPAGDAPAAPGISGETGLRLADAK